MKIPWLKHSNPKHCHRQVIQMKPTGKLAVLHWMEWASSQFPDFLPREGNGGCSCFPLSGMKTHAEQKGGLGQTAVSTKGQATKVSRCTQVMWVSGIQRGRPGPIKGVRLPSSLCGQCQWQLSIQGCQMFQHVQSCQRRNILSFPKAGNPDFYATLLDCWVFVMNSTFLKLPRLNKTSICAMWTFKLLVFPGKNKGFRHTRGKKFSEITYWLCNMG